LQEVVDLPGPAVRIRLDEREGDPAGRALYHRGVHALAADLDVLLEGLGEPEHVLVVLRGRTELAGRYTDRQVVDRAQQFADAVAGPAHVLGRGMLGRQSGGQHETDVALP